jgi:hypothetical protein
MKRYSPISDLLSIPLACLLAAGLHTGCSSGKEQTGAQNGITQAQFNALMARVEQGWSTQNTDLALSAFDSNCIYMEPPNEQLYVGHAQLRPYFGALSPRHFMKWHVLAFNPATQQGMGEYSFGRRDADSCLTGVAVIELKNGKIAFWREYQRRGPARREQFLDTAKTWQWHIGNYPPKPVPQPAKP